MGRYRFYRRPVIRIPFSTPEILVFPYDEKNHTFKTSNYKADHTQGRATAEEVEEFLKEVHPFTRSTSEKNLSVRVIPFLSALQKTLFFSSAFFYLVMLSYFTQRSFLFFHHTNLGHVPERTNRRERVNVPIRAFYQDQISTCKLACIIILCMIIFPLYPFMLCWICHRNKKMQEELRKTTDRASVIIKSRGTTFTDRGMMWNIPAHFPKWIELWTQVGEYGQPVVMQPTMQQDVEVNQQFQTMPTYQRPAGESPGAVGFPGIEMQAVPQQTYQQNYYQPQGDQQQNFANYQNNFAPNNQV